MISVTIGFLPLNVKLQICGSQGLMAKLDEHIRVSLIKPEVALDLGEKAEEEYVGTFNRQDASRLCDWLQEYGRVHSEEVEFKRA